MLWSLSFGIHFRRHRHRIWSCGRCLIQNLYEKFPTPSCNGIHLCEASQETQVKVYLLSHNSLLVRIDTLQLDSLHGKRSKQKADKVEGQKADITVAYRKHFLCVLSDQFRRM